MSHGNVRIPMFIKFLEDKNHIDVINVNEIKYMGLRTEVINKNGITPNRIFIKLNEEQDNKYIFSKTNDISILKQFIDEFPFPTINVMENLYLAKELITMEVKL